MKHKISRIRKGFTLLEVLLVIAAIGILAAIVLVAINPTRQIAQVRNAQRRADINTIYKALEQYLIDNKTYPTDITDSKKVICNTGSKTTADTLDPTNLCAGKADLRVLVPTYLAAIPKDPSGGLYAVYINLSNYRIAVEAPDSELGQNIAINIITTIPTPIVAAAAKDPSLDTGIPVGFNNRVNTLAIQTGGKIIVGGDFTNYQGVAANRIVRFNTDVTIDTSFNTGTGFNSSVDNLAIQTDGKIIVGGWFTTYQGVEANSIIRLNSDGTRDTSFNPGTGFNNRVNTLAIQTDGKIIVGGKFTTYQGVAANNIIRLNSDGTRDNSFNLGTGFASTIWFDGVRTLAIQTDGKIIVGGSFNSYQGVAANSIIRLNSDGTRDNSFNLGTGFAGTIGTGFDSLGVNTLGIQTDGKIIVGGWFRSYQGVEANSIIRLNSDGTRDTSFNLGTGFANIVNTLGIQTDGKIIVGGPFSSYQGVAANNIIRLNSDGTRDNSFNQGTGFASSVLTLGIQTDGKIIVGGPFSSYQGVAVNRIVRLNTDGTRDTSVNPGNGFDSASLRTLAIQTDGKIIVGGYFSSYQGVAANSIIRLNSDGTRDNSFNPSTGFSDIVQTLVIQTDGKIIVGGSFSSYQGVAANSIIRLNSDGTIDTSFNQGTGFNNRVENLAIQADGKIIVGGGFTSYQGVEANRIVRLNTDGTRDTSFNLGTGFNNILYTLSIQTDGKIIVGGWFTTYQGVEANRIVRLNTDGTRDTSFNLGTGFNSSVDNLAIQTDGKIIVGGQFISYQGVAANYIIRLNSDGTRDTSFNPGTGFNSSVSTLAIQTDGKIIVGGGFTSYQDQITGYLTRLGN